MLCIIILYIHIRITLRTLSDFIKITKYIPTNPAASGLALWHAGFIGAFVPVWIYVYDSVNYNRFFVEQVKRVTRSAR